MPIKSYLVFPQSGQKKSLAGALNEMPCCEVIPSENRGVMVLVTDTKDNDQDEKCLNDIKNIKSLEHITLVAGFNDDVYA